MPAFIALVAVVIAAKWFWNTITSTPWLMWSLVGLLGLFGFLAMWGFYENRKWAKSPEGKRALKEKNGRRLKLINPPERFPRELYIGHKDHGLLSLDPKGQQLAFGSPTGWAIFNFEDIFGAELDIGQGEIIKTSSSRSVVGAVVGGAAFGVAGAIVGGTGGRTTSTTSKIIEHVVLRIQVRDMEKPVREIFFQTNQSGQQLGREWLARIQMIVDENERAPTLRASKTVPMQDRDVPLPAK